MREYIGEELIEIANKGSKRAKMEKEKMRTKKITMVFLSVISGAFLACFLPLCLSNIKVTAVTAGCMAAFGIIAATVEEVTK